MGTNDLRKKMGIQGASPLSRRSKAHSKNSRGSRGSFDCSSPSKTLMKTSSQGGLEELNFSQSDFLTELDPNENNLDTEILDVQKIPKTNRDKI